LKKEGLGIGLSICRSIIEDHDGKIWAENMPDGGAKFSFSLRILKDE
jgi:K+-sensing histidine kinase KdpD